LRKIDAFVDTTVLVQVGLEIDTAKIQIFTNVALKTAV